MFPLVESLGSLCEWLDQFRAVLNVPAMFIIGAVSILLIIGIKESANFNNAIVALKLVVILTFIIIGACYIKPSNWHPFVPPLDLAGSLWVGGGVVRAAGVIFFAYIGFDAVSTAAQECKKPQRDMPIAPLLGSLAICTVLLHFGLPRPDGHGQLHAAQCIRAHRRGHQHPSDRRWRGWNTL